MISPLASLGQNRYFPSILLPNTIQRKVPEFSPQNCTDYVDFQDFDGAAIQIEESGLGEHLDCDKYYPKNS